MFFIVVLESSHLKAEKILQKKKKRFRVSDIIYKD